MQVYFYLFIVFISCISCHKEQNKYNIPTGKFVGHQLGHDFHLEIKKDSSQDNYKINYIDVIDNGKYINTNWEGSIFAASFISDQINNNRLDIEIKNFRNYDEEKGAFNKLPITITFVNQDTIEWLAFPNSEKLPHLLPKQISLLKESENDNQ